MAAKSPLFIDELQALIPTDLRINSPIGLVQKKSVSRTLVCLLTLPP